MAYLDTYRPARDQWYDRRNRPLTGCTVLHTAESVMDTVGPDTGAEAVAGFIRGRSTPGSYHDLVDSDTAIQLVGYDHGAYHDGTGSNNWALSISFACRTSDWDDMSPAKRQGFLHQGAVAFARQQEYRKRVGAPLTELRLISKAQSDAGVSGFTYHGLRDPGRRTDPGVAEPHLFPFGEFIAECRAVLGGAPIEEDFMAELSDEEQRAMYNRINYIWKEATPGSPGYKNDGRVFAELTAVRAENAALRAAVAADKDLDPVELERIIHDALAKSVVNVDVSVNDGQQ